ncbi:hypothetical protein CDAR_375111 [Caerostris darwini]|uniref:Ycf15 n=1 Tax=Caerostris darwini TaxID=1538125 RepID=A0AAV4RNE9_9ARAC|nr:hypothetical protein CDAR_375111 [Caerostris darwini]
MKSVHFNCEERKQHIRPNPHGTFSRMQSCLFGFALGSTRRRMRRIDQRRAIPTDPSAADFPEKQFLFRDSVSHHKRSASFRSPLTARMWSGSTTSPR